ncbi:MAG: hypothetical protein WDO19_00400 [Bacteroidota bacterium]
MNNTKSSSLLLCIVMDIIGCATYSVPVLGEFGDLVWAPISAFIFFRMFGGWKGAVGGVFNFIEEILPGTDFIPSFTLMWLWQNFRQAKKSPVTMQTN